MSGWLLLLTILAVGLLGFGAQVLSQQFGRFPTDVRRPGALIQIRRSKPAKNHSPELRRLVTVISYAILDDPTSKVELQKTFQELDSPVSPLAESAPARRGQHKRSGQIDQAIAALEERYLL
ncbi:MAG: hypothetical protein ACRBK7_10890 [Acidimicrobiales bacterium]